MKPEPITYLTNEQRWLNTSYVNEIKSYYSDIKDILMATTNSVESGGIREEYTHRLALMQTKAAFRLPGDPLNPNIE